LTTIQIDNTIESCLTNERKHDRFKNKI